MHSGWLAIHKFAPLEDVHACYVKGSQSSLSMTIEARTQLRHQVLFA